MLFASSGKFYTLDAAKLPGGRGHGEPVRLMADLEATDEIVALFVHRPGASCWWRPATAQGFIVPEDECLAKTRKGKQVLNVKPPVEAQVCAILADEADHIATIGENRKLLIFQRSEVPEMTRGRASGCRSTRMADCLMRSVQSEGGTDMD